MLGSITPKIKDSILDVSLLQIRQGTGVHCDKSSGSRVKNSKGIETDCTRDINAHHSATDHL